MIDAILVAILSPLIRRDLRLRKAGLRPDEWYWADRLAIRCGLLFKIRYD